MKKCMCFKTIVITVAFLAAIMAVGHVPHLFGEGNGKYILVTLKDKSVEKFEYDAFSFNWVLPQIKNEVTCEVEDFLPADLEKIFVLSQTWNSCDEKDDWVFDVYLKDRRPIQGFFELTAEKVTGKVYETGKIKSIPFQDISKVTYH